MQLSAAVPPRTGRFLVFLRLLSRSKHAKVPVCFFLKQLKASGSSCRHSIKRACTTAGCSPRSTCTAGLGQAGQEELCVYSAARALFRGYLSAPYEQRKGARAGLEASPAVTVVVREEKPLPLAEQA